MASPNTAINFGTSRDLTTNIVLSFVAQLLDFDIGIGASSDIPTDVVEGFIREGFEKIVMADTGWPYYQASYTFNATPTLDIQTLTSVGTTATATFDQPHGFLDGSKVQISEVVPTGYNSQSVDDYNIAIPSLSISSITTVGTTATLTTVGAHGYSATNPPQVLIKNVLPRGYNGTYDISVTGASTFTYTLAEAQSATTTLGTVQDANPINFTYTLASPLGTVTALGSADSGSAVLDTNGRGYNANFLITTNDPISYVASIDSIAKITNCVNVTNMGNQLIYIDNYRAEQVWPVNSDNDIPGIPAYWSLWGNAINLWPKPDSLYQIQVMGYRRFSLFWLSDTTLPIDIDPEFHMPLMNYVLARVFQFQEDPDMAAIYMNNYEQGVAMIRGWKTSVNRNQSMILSGGLQINPYDYYRYMTNLSLNAVATGQWR